MVQIHKENTKEENGKKEEDWKRYLKKVQTRKNAKMWHVIMSSAL